MHDYKYFTFHAGSLIKIVYFSRHSDSAKKPFSTTVHGLERRRETLIPSLRNIFPILGGRLHFVKFETSKMNECVDFIVSKKLYSSRIACKPLSIYLN